MKKTVIIVVAFAVLLSSCVMSTMVTIDTVPDQADVFVDGQPEGESPVTVKMSNAVWEDPDILIRKEGYKDLRISPNKEVKAINLVGGLLLWWPSLLWVYGPEENQTFMLSDDK